MSDKTLTIDELADVLKMRPETARHKYRRAPATLPPPVLMPGAKSPIWLESTVFAWLKKHESTTEPGGEA